MKKSYLFLLLGALLALVLSPEALPVTATEGRPPHSEVPSVPLIASLRAAAAGNLLVNGNMEELPFYWMYPNHYVAGGWGRWWIHGTVLPEYDDTRGTRPHYHGNDAQVYFKWFGRGQEYHAGIYQVVDDLIPCVPYRFTMWGRNHTLEMVKPRARIGLDPLGTQLTSGPEEGAVIALPPSTVWSAEQVDLFVWEQLAVEATPVGNRLTAITYAHPELPASGGPDSYYADTFWDAGRLEASSFPGGKLPYPPTAEATAFISDITVQADADSVTIAWNIAEPAPTQVWYRVIPKPADPTPITETIVIAHHIYFPIIQNSIAPGQYTQLTPVHIEGQTSQQATISNLQAGDKVQGIILVRRPIQGACTTEISIPFDVTINASK